MASFFTRLSHGLFSVNTGKRGIFGTSSSSDKDATPLGSGLLLMTSFNHYLLCHVGNYSDFNNLTTTEAFTIVKQ
jgi:hypothetical protein